MRTAEWDREFPLFRRLAFAAVRLHCVATHIGSATLALSAAHALVVVLVGLLEVMTDQNGELESYLKVWIV